MKILLDTHCWLWWLVEPEKLSQTAITPWSCAIATIQNNQNKLYLSVASIWEIAIKYKLGKLDLPIPPEILIPQQIQIDKIFPLSISVAHALQASILPLYHKDPFARMLIAQSQLESMTIISNDSVFNSYDIQILW